jgi:[NiFe] hydrogenase assembly HybE family chaperone
MTTAGRSLRHDGPTIVAEHFGFTENPAPTLERVFSDVYLHRMQDVPLCNHALGVEAVGFRRTDDGWLGVLVTPWFMNLMLLPARGEHWTHMLLGAKRWHRFASGDYELFGSEEEGMGEYHYFSLFSPMAGFSSQDEAVSVAEAALTLVIDSDTAGKVEAHGKRDAREVEPVHAPKIDGAPIDVGKRNFLRGHFSRTRH